MGGSAVGQSAPSDSDIDEAVLELVAILAPDKGVDVTWETSLIDGLGYDSAQLVELGLALERRLGCALKQTQLGATTVADLAAIVRASFQPESPWGLTDAFSAEQAALAGAGVPAGVATPGDLLDDFDLIDIDGVATTLLSAVGGRPAVVVLYRGVWCPYCNIALRTYQNELVPALDDRLVALIAISPQTPAGSRSTLQRNNLTFTVLSDPGNTVATAWHVQTAPTPEVVEAQMAMGIDLTDANADGSTHVPMPTVAVVDGDGVLRWIDVRPDYTTRTTVADILAAVDSLG